MVGADVVVIDFAGLLDGVFDDLLGPGTPRQFARAGRVRPRHHNLLDFAANPVEIDGQVLQDVRSDTGTLPYQTQENVLGADVLVIEALRLLVGQLHHFAGSVGETLVHGR